MQMTEAPTRERILDAAERLFAERGGEDGASMRDLATAAKVRLSQLSYHFGSKEALYRAVFTRRASELAHAREVALSDALGKPAPTIDDIMSAFVGPSVRQRLTGGVQGAAFALLTAREAVDPREAARGVLAEHFDPTAARFIAALARLYPDATPAATAEAYFFAAGALVMTTVTDGRISRLVGQEGMQDPSALVQRLTAFCAAGADAVLSGHRGARNDPSAVGEACRRHRRVPSVAEDAPPPAGDAGSNRDPR
jgi:AcrR family transcriptional regulator